MSAATDTQIALYNPTAYPGQPGEVCRHCTGSGHREAVIAGKRYQIECAVCEGGGTVTAIVIRGAS